MLRHGQILLFGALGLLLVDSIVNRTGITYASLADQNQSKGSKSRSGFPGSEPFAPIAQRARGGTECEKVGL